MEYIAGLSARVAKYSDDLALHHWPQVVGAQRLAAMPSGRWSAINSPLE
jgi:hypothetical protein